MAMDIQVYKNTSQPVTIYATSPGPPPAPLLISAATEILLTVTNPFSKATILTKTLTGGGITVVNGPTLILSGLSFTISSADLTSINPGVYSYTVSVTLPASPAVVLKNVDGTTGSFTVLA